MSFITTPHINAEADAFGKTVLMPGDPLRSKFIAENYLENAKLVNNVRGIQGYTGTYKGTKVSVMASGMGMPTIGIYSYELFTFFGVDNIMRIGSTGECKGKRYHHWYGRMYQFQLCKPVRSGRNFCTNRKLSSDEGSNQSGRPAACKLPCR